MNHKRVERLFGPEALEARRRRRKKIPVADRQPPVRPAAANEVGSVEFVFGRAASCRSLKRLVIVDDATHEAVAIVAERRDGGNHLTRLLDEVCPRRGRRL